MTKAEITNGYFEWLYRIVNGEVISKVSYRKLLKKLYGTPFTWTIPMDANRVGDGINLRYRYGDEMEIHPGVIASFLDTEDRPCSILEMMIGLALRCEESIMTNTDYGDRTGQWFWGMIVNLGLGSQSDEQYDENEIDDILEIFLNRQYAPNGEGGLFRLHSVPEDLRTVEIWYQMCWYLDEIIEN